MTIWNPLPSSLGVVPAQRPKTTNYSPKTTLTNRKIQPTFSKTKIITPRIATPTIPEENNLSSVWTTSFLQTHSKKRPMSAQIHALHQNLNVEKHPFGMTSTRYIPCKRRDPSLYSVVARLVASRSANSIPSLSYTSSLPSTKRQYMPLNLDLKYKKQQLNRSSALDGKAQADAIMRLATNLKQLNQQQQPAKMISSQDTKMQGRQMMNTKIDQSKAADVRNRQKQYSRQIEKAGGKSIELQIDTITRAVVQNFRKLINTERCALFLMDHSTNELYFKPVGGLDADVPEIRFPATAGIAGWVAMHVRELNIPDAYIDDRFNPEIDRKTGFRTRNILCMPVMDHETGKLLAVCQMVNKFEKQKVLHNEMIGKGKSGNAAGGGESEMPQKKSYVSFGGDDEGTLRRCCLRVAEALHILRDLQKKESEQQSNAINNKNKRKNGRGSITEGRSARIQGAGLNSRRGSKAGMEDSDFDGHGRTHRISSRRMSRGFDLSELGLDDQGESKGQASMLASAVSSRRGSVNLGDEGGAGTRSRRGSISLVGDGADDGHDGHESGVPRSRRMSKDFGSMVGGDLSQSNSRAGSRRGSLSAPEPHELNVNNQAKNEVINFINFMSAETAKFEAEQRAKQGEEESNYGNGATTAAEAFSKFNFRDASGPQMSSKGQTMDAPEKREAANRMKRQKAYTKQCQQGDVNDSQQIMNRALRGIISKFKQLMECERCGLFFVDDETDELYFQVEEEGAEIRFPKHLGIAGSVCTSGVGILIPDAYKDSRFNQAVDKQTGFKTHNILCQPIKNIVGDVIAVVQMVNCAKEGGFGQKDIDTLAVCATKVSRGLEAIKDSNQGEVRSATLMESRMQSVNTINDVIKDINKEIEKEKRAYLARRREESRHEFTANEAASRFTFRDRKEDKSKFMKNALLEVKEVVVEKNTKNWQTNHAKFREIFGENA